MRWIGWMAPPALAMQIVAPAYATEYVTIEQAQRLAFPAADVIYKAADIESIEKLSGQKVLARGEQVWRAEAGGQLLGYFIVDYVIGKHLVIDYAVSLEADGRVRRVEILQYRESYGGEIANRDWLAQFNGKTNHDALEIDSDIRNISGATISSRHVAEGVKRVLAFYDVCLKGK